MPGILADFQAMYRRCRALNGLSGTGIFPVPVLPACVLFNAFYRDILGFLA
jgi:hypothetical protein